MWNLKETPLESGLCWAGEDLAAGFGHTCEASNGSHSKIDYMLANPAARAICTAAEIDRDTGIATHAYLQATFALGRRAFGPIQRPTPKWESERGAATRGEITCRLAEHNATRACVKADFDASWRVLSDCAGEWTKHLAGKADKRRKGEGVVVEGCPVAKVDSPCGAEPNLVLTQITRQRRRLEQLAKLMFQGRGGSTQAVELRARCRNYCPGALAARMGGLPLTEAREVATLAANLRREETKVDRDIRQQRMGAWKQRQHDWFANKKGKLFNWIKDQGAKPANLAVVCTLPEEPPSDPNPWQDAGEDVGLGEAEGDAPRRYLNEGKFEQDDPFLTQNKLETAWTTLWQGSREPGLDFNAMLAPLRTLPAFPAREGWTGDTVRMALQAMDKGKAPGLDEWYVHELRELTPTLREGIADLLNEVETQGRWPTSLPGPLGILLPKGAPRTPWTAARFG